jgi:hypothetical protein
MPNYAVAARGRGSSGDRPLPPWHAADLLDDDPEQHAGERVVSLCSIPGLRVFPLAWDGAHRRERLPRLPVPGPKHVSGGPNPSGQGSAGQGGRGAEPAVPQAGSALAFRDPLAALASGTRHAAPAGLLAIVAPSVPLPSDPWSLRR